MPPWPRRDHVCTDCRTLLPPDTACPGGARHRVVPLDGAGRESLLHAVWGPKSLRQHLRAAGKTAATGGGTGGLLDGCGDCGGCGSLGPLDEVLGVIVLLAVAFFALYFVFVGVRALVRRARRPRPRGAYAAGAGVGPATGRVGTIRAAASAPSPLDGTLGVGFALELDVGTGWFRRATTARDGVGLGFEVVLDDGDVVEIPAGPLIVDLANAPTETAVAWIDDYRNTIDPARATADDLDPFPADRARHLVLRAGDRVEVRGRLRALPGAALYRETPVARLAPVDTPRIVTAPRR